MNGTYTVYLPQVKSVVYTLIKCTFGKHLIRHISELENNVVMGNKEIFKKTKNCENGCRAGSI